MSSKKILSKGMYMTAVMEGGVQRCVATQDISIGVDVFNKINHTSHIVDYPTRTSMYIDGRHREHPLLASVNHSFEPNLMVYVGGLRAIKDIVSGEELTINYVDSEPEISNPFIDRDTGKPVGDINIKDSLEEPENPFGYTSPDLSSLSINLDDVVKAFTNLSHIAIPTQKDPVMSELESAECNERLDIIHDAQSITQSIHNITDPHFLPNDVAEWGPILDMLGHMLDDLKMSVNNLNNA